MDKVSGLSYAPFVGPRECATYESETMVLSILAGIVTGVLGFLPLVGALHLTRRINAGNNMVSMSTLLLGLVVSMLVLALPLVVVALQFRDVVIPFVFAEVIALVVTAITYGVMKLVRKEKRKGW